MVRLEDQTRMVCRPSFPRTAGLLVLNLGMLGAAWWTARQVPWMWELWAGLVFFSLTLVALLVHPFRRAGTITFGPEGIEDRRARMRPFRWNEIRRLVVVKYQSHKFLAVQVDRLADHAPPPRRWWPAWFKNMMRWAPYYFRLDETYHVLNLVGLSPGLPAAVAFLRDQLGKKVEERRGG